MLSFFKTNFTKEEKVFKGIVFLCSTVFLVMFLGCSKESSLVGYVQNEKVATIGTYNSFPWNWHLPYVGSAYVTQSYNGACWTVPGKPPSHVIGLYYAVDFSGRGAASGQPVKACAAGYVKFAGWASGSNSAFGNQVIVEAGSTGQSAPNQNNRYLYRVAHMSSVSVVAGWWVERGTVLGYVGSTGASTGAHIHFEVKRGIYPGYGGISGESFPPSFSGGIDGYSGQCGYYQQSGQ